MSNAMGIRNTRNRRAEDEEAARVAQAYDDGVADTMATYVDITVNPDFDPSGYKDLINGDIDYADYDWSTYPWKVTTAPEDWDEKKDGVFKSEINYDWYANDPLWVTSAVTNNLDLSTPEGLQETAAYIAETTKVVLGGGYADVKWRQHWKEIKEGTHDYSPKKLNVEGAYTPMEMPRMAESLPSPEEPESLAMLRHRAGADMARKHHNSIQ